MKTSQEIRQALIQIADKANRPHYTQMVVRDVIHAIRNDLDHPLKARVMSEKTILKTNPDETPVGHLIKFCQPRGIRQVLADLAGFSERLITAYITGDLPLPNNRYEEISKHFDAALNEFKKGKSA